MSELLIAADLNYPDLCLQIYQVSISTIPYHS